MDTIPSHSLARRVATLVCGAGLFAGALLPSVAMAQDRPGQDDDPLVTVPGDAAPALDRAQVVRERLVFLLSGFEYFPTRKDLDGVANEATISALLIELATQAVPERASLQLRAVDALGYYSTPKAIATLRQIAAAPLPATITDAARIRLLDARRHHAITSYVRAAGPDALKDVAPLLDDRDLQIQLTAIVAIGRHGGTPGRALLQTKKKGADDPFVLRELRRQLR